MSVMNMLGVSLMGKEFHDEFGQMVKDCLKINRDNQDCTYIDAFASPFDPDLFMVTSIWTSEEALMEWYRSPFHMELRERGMQGMLRSYFTHLGELLPEKSHEWTRPEKAGSKS